MRNIVLVYWLYYNKCIQNRTKQQWLEQNRVETDRQTKWHMYYIILVTYDRSCPLKVKSLSTYTSNTPPLPSYYDNSVFFFFTKDTVLFVVINSVSLVIIIHSKQFLFIITNINTKHSSPI